MTPKDFSPAPENGKKPYNKHNDVFYCPAYVPKCRQNAPNTAKIPSKMTPSWPSWAPSWTCAAKLGCQGALARQVGLSRRTWTPIGHQLNTNWTPNRAQMDAKWTPSERQVGLSKQLPVPTYVLRTPKQLPGLTERLASSAYVAV